MALCVTGGDGALWHELQRHGPPFPPITLRPAGRGNALARDLRRAPGPVAVDVFDVRVRPASGPPYSRFCASSVAFGYPASVTRVAERFRPLGRLSYGAAAAFVRPKRGWYSIGYDGAKPAKKLLTGILVNNTRHVGGFVAFEQASYCDGLADVMELDAGYLSQMAHNVGAMAGVAAWRPARFLQVRQVEVHCPEPGALMLDGELLAPAVSIQLALLPAALSLSIG